MKHQKKLTILFIIIFLTPLLTDQWAPKGPVSYWGHSSIFEMWLAEVFPKDSRLKNERPICYFYRENRIKEDEKYDVNERFEIIWQGDLVNNTAPNAAFVAPTSQLITLDEHMFLGSKHSLVIYDKNGNLLKDYSLSDMIPEDDIMNKIQISTSSIWWRHKARYFFTNPNVKSGEQSWWNPTHFYIVLEYGYAIEIKLEDGTNKYDKLVNFPWVDNLCKEKFVNDEEKIREIDLRNSSVTELLNCSVR